MLTFSSHCKIGFLIRILMIIYGTLQDQTSDVKYTDVDYKVFTDAARHIVEGNSPYERHTYRYSPLLAFILTPNIFFHSLWGKFLFSVGDIIVCIFIRSLLKAEKIDEKTILRSVYFWLYNPMIIVISTRGNSDSLSAVLVLGTLVVFKNKMYILAGILHSFSIHLRIYPIAFSLCMYLSIPNNIKVNDKEPTIKKIFKNLFPNFCRLKLTLSCLLGLLLITGVFYSLYGCTFLYESTLYHLKRQDTRHNFSVFFYLQYLSSTDYISLIQKVLTLLPQVIVLTAITFTYGNSGNMQFCQLCLAIVMVSYNSVLTCQYFVWFMSLVPLSLPYLRFTSHELIKLAILWFLAQLTWLLPAYLLEFRGQNTFIFIWVQGIAFFCANMAILARLIRSYRKNMCQESICKCD